MKHNLRITILLIAMFIATQFIGVLVINHYSSSTNHLPYGMETPEMTSNQDFYNVFPSIIIAFLIAIALFFLLTRFKAEFILRLWFFVVILIAIGIFINALLPNESLGPFIALIFALPFALMKVYRNNFIVHNLTELVIYPSIASVFVPLLNLLTVIILLILISLYDMWAVWRSGIMQKMAKYQMNTLKIFSGFFVPYISKKDRMKLKKAKKSKIKDKNIKVNVAILGGGDVIFPIISAGVMMKTFPESSLFGIPGLIPALFVIFGAMLGLALLLINSKKKKFYPAMPFITSGIFLGMLLFKLFFL